MTGYGKALLLIRDKEIKGCRQFAELMWADSDCWQKVHNVGHGATRGAGMWRAGGSLLGRLYHAGLIYRFISLQERLRLTPKGVEKLNLLLGNIGVRAK